jgi:hypothetical protein
VFDQHGHARQAGIAAHELLRRIASEGIER